MVEYNIIILISTDMCEYVEDQFKTSSPFKSHPNNFKADWPALKACLQSRPVLKLSGCRPDGFKTVLPDKKTVNQVARVQPSEKHGT